jgi:hypothetical protein
MQSSSVAIPSVLLLLVGGVAGAQEAPPVLPSAPGFGVERLAPSAPGGGWLVMDQLDLPGPLGGAMSVTLGYARNPLRVGEARLPVVSDQATVDIGAALSYWRIRVYLNFAAPLAIYGQSGDAGGYAFTGPSVNLGSNPDTIADVRFGADVRILGRTGGRFRLGAGAQLDIPTDRKSDYASDGTFRGALRLLVAGDARWLTWAAQLGAHIRPRDDAPIPDSPRGSELLFGAAAGGRIALGRAAAWALILGPELFGASAFRALFTRAATAFEGLLTARFEGTAADRAQLRVRVGAGAGLGSFGSPEWRVVAGVELFTHNQR